MNVRATFIIQVPTVKWSRLIKNWSLLTWRDSIQTAHSISKSELIIEVDLSDAISGCIFAFFVECQLPPNCLFLDPNWRRGDLKTRPLLVLGSRQQATAKKGRKEKSERASGQDHHLVPHSRTGRARAINAARSTKSTSLMHNSNCFEFWGDYSTTLFP